MLVFLVRMKFFHCAFSVWCIYLLQIASTHATSKLSEQDVENLEQFSYQVSLRNADDNTHFCSGSILSKRHILTAAHCVHHVHSAKKRNHTEIKVVAAQLHLNVTHDSIMKTVAKIIVHPKYKNVTFQNDIAILVLKNSLDLSNPFISTVKLRSTEKMGNCYVSGWGAINNRASHEDFTYENVEIMSRPACQQSYNNQNMTISNNVICTESKEEICKGDSGGPLLCRGVLTGVTSYCGKTGSPGVHTNLGHMRKWINKIIRNRNH